MGSEDYFGGETSSRRSIKAALILFATDHHNFPTETIQDTVLVIKLALLDDLNTFAGEIFYSSPRWAICGRFSIIGLRGLVRLF